MKAGSGLSLAFGEAGRESMSDAGSRRRSRGTSGGPEAAARAQARAEDEGTYRRKAPQVLRACLPWRAAREGVLALADQARDAGCGGRGRQGVSASQRAGIVLGR